MPGPDTSKRHTLGTSVSKVQYDYVSGRAKRKGLSVSDYVRNLIARGLRLEMAEEKTNQTDDGLDDFFA